MSSSLSSTRLPSFSIASENKKSEMLPNQLISYLNSFNVDIKCHKLSVIPLFITLFNTESLVLKKSKSLNNLV